MINNFAKKFAVLMLLAVLTLATPQQIWANTEVELKVYKHIELVSLVMRLAGFSEYTDERTDYQRSLMPAFAEFAEHPVVEFAVELRASVGLSFDAPMQFAIHLEKVEDQFQLMYGSYIWELDSRWTPESAEKFLELLNDFYIESNFAEFFQENMPYFKEISQRVADELTSKINFSWFYQFGFSEENLRITIYPSGSSGGYGPTQLGTVSYAILPTVDYFGDFLEFAVHEFAHSFANPIAEEWYEADEDFRRISYYSVDMERMPWYGTSIIMAYEYVTRAYTILYLVENHDKNLVHLLLGEMAGGFPYIELIYAKITDHDIIFTPDADILAMVLGEGIEYELGEKQIFVMEERYIALYPIDLKGVELPLDELEHNNMGNVIRTETGDIYIFVENHNERRYLQIDLGEDPRGIEWGMEEGILRKYSMFALDDEDSYTIAQILFGALGREVDYSIEERARTYVTREEDVFYFHALYLSGAEITLESFSANNSGNIFNTYTGDFIIVIKRGNRYLYIDLGPHPLSVEWGAAEGEVRLYSVFPLDVRA